MVQSTDFQTSSLYELLPLIKQNKFPQKFLSYLLPDTHLTWENFMHLNLYQ